MTSGLRAGGSTVIPLARILTAVVATAMRVYHLYSAGTTYHGAAAVEVRANMSSSAARYSRRRAPLRMSSAVIFQCLVGVMTRSRKRHRAFLGDRWIGAGKKGATRRHREHP